MSISITNKARIIASLTVGGFIVLIFIAMGCKGNYGVIEEEQVSFESPPTATIAVETFPEATLSEPKIESLPEIVVKPDTIRKVMYKEAEAAFLARDYNEAVDLFTHYTRRKKNNAWGFYMLGLSAKRAGDLDLAAEALEIATDLDPDHIKSWINLGRVYLEMNQPARGIIALDRAISIDPATKDAYRLKGRAHHQQGDLAEAERAYKLALAANAQDAWAMNNLAFVHLRQDRYEEALPLLALAIQLKEDVAIFYNNLGMALENKGHFRAAEEAYARAVNLDAGYTKASLNKDRVAKVDESKGLTPVDLTQIAQNLKEEMKTWKQLLADEGE